MKPLEVIVLTPSEIIGAGLHNIILSFKFPGIHLHRLSRPEEMESVALVHTHPLLLIADTAIFRSAFLTEFRANHPELVAAIGITHCALPPDAIAGFDMIMSIYSEAQTLRGELKKAINAAEGRKDGSRTGNSDELTPREKEIIIAVVKGLSNKEIAAQLSVSVNTVMTHRRNIASKLEIHSAAGLTIYAIVSKLVSIDQIKNQIG